MQLFEFNLHARTGRSRDLFDGEGELNPSGRTQSEQWVRKPVVGFSASSEFQARSLSRLVGPSLPLSDQIWFSLKSLFLCHKVSTPDTHFSEFSVSFLCMAPVDGSSLFPGIAFIFLCSRISPWPYVTWPSGISPSIWMNLLSSRDGLSCDKSLVTGVLWYHYCF